MVVRLVADRDAFAAERKAILDRADAQLEPVVRAALARYRSDEQWYEPVRDAALALWDDVAAQEYPDPSSVLDEFRAAYSAALEESLAQTSEPADPPTDGQVQAITRWLSTATVNHATMAAAEADTEEDGLTLEWVSMRDEDVRVSHRAADGQVVPVGATFEVDGYDVHFPGEPVGPPEVWINCRCVVRIGLGGDMTATTETGGTITVEFDEETLAALTAAAESDETDEDAPTLPEDFDMGPTPWHGVLTVEGVMTGDRRKFLAEALTWDTLPLPLRWQKVDQPGHDGSVVVGRIDRIWREGAEIKAEGIFHDSEESVEVMELIGEQMLRGVSVDVDSAEMELQTEDGDAFDWDEAGDERPVTVFSAGRVRSAAICSIPAFAEAFVALGPWGDSPLPEAEDEDGQTASGEFAPGTRDGPGWITHPRATQRITNYWVKGPGAAKIGWGAPNDFYRCRRQLAKYVQNPKWLSGLCANLHKRALGIWPGEHRADEAIETGGEIANFECHDCLESLVASGWAAPAQWLVDPELDGPTPLTVTDEGRVFGHVATWGTCHIGYPGACVTPPRSAREYADFHVHSVPTDNGEDTPCGYITIDTGHAPLSAKARPAMAHYDNTGTAVAFVRAGEDTHGIWVAGVVNPRATDDQVLMLRGAALSGDWRRVAGGMEMVAALAVNVPGYPIPRTSLAASAGVQESLVAAAPVVRPEPPDIKAVVRQAVSETLAQMRAAEERQARVARAKARMRAERAAMVKERVG